MSMSEYNEECYECGRLMEAEHGYCASCGSLNCRCPCEIDHILCWRCAAMSEFDCDVSGELGVPVVESDDVPKGIALLRAPSAKTIVMVLPEEGYDV